MSVKLIGRPLILWLVLTVAYGVALQIFKNYEVLSFLYHIGLLGLALYYVRTAQELGLVSGKLRVGLAGCVLTLLFPIARTLLLGGTFRFEFELNVDTFSVALLIIFFAPITEELFWRGFLLQRMLKHSKTDHEKSLAILLNILLFVFMHIPRIIRFNEWPTAYMIFMAGVILVTVYYVSESVYYSTACHIIWNALSFVLHALG